jgi:hypothetical protein
MSVTVLDALHGCIGFLRWGGPATKVIDVATAPSDICGGEVYGLAGHTVEDRAHPHHSFE